MLHEGRKLIAAKLFDEADRVLGGAVSCWPDDPEIAVAFAFSANDSARYEVSISRWDQVRDRWPDVPIAWAGSAANRRETHRCDEAWGIISEAMARFPGDRVAIIEAIRIAERLGKSDQAQDLRSKLWRLAPDDIEAFEGHVKMLLRADRIEELRSDLARAAVGQRPDDVRLRFAAAALALKLDTWPEFLAEQEELDRRTGREVGVLEQRLRALAIEKMYYFPAQGLLLFRYVRARCDRDAEVWHGIADTLTRLGRLDEAERELGAAKVAEVDHWLLRRAAAVIASRREDWPRALPLFEQVAIESPDDVVTLSELGRVRMERSFERRQDGHAAAAAPRQDVGRVHDEATRDLLLGFESIGQDCEFGLVQRRFGAEPISLFRWNFVKARALIDCLNKNLDGLGDPDHTILSLWSDFEYYLSDRRWGFGFHTFLSKNEIAADVLFPKMCRRLAYLRDMFLADLATGDKTLIFKSLDDDPGVLSDLHRSLRAYGPVRLLCVRSIALANEPSRRAGDVVELERNFFVGFIGRFGNRDLKWEIAFDEWVAICRKVAAQGGAALVGA